MDVVPLNPTQVVHLAHLHLVHVVHMAALGLLVSLVAPGLANVAALFPAADRLAPPARTTLPVFAALYLAVTVALGGSAGTGRIDPAGPFATAAHVLLLAGAVLFWAPVLGVRRRLPDRDRAVYLLLACPVLGLVAAWPVARGDGAGGLALIVGTLPIAAAAIAMTWSRVTEERAARHARRGQGWACAPSRPRPWWSVAFTAGGVGHACADEGGQP